MMSVKGEPLTNREARERLVTAEDKFAEITGGLSLLDQDGDSAVFVMCDGETVRGWRGAMAAAEKLLAFALRQGAGVLV